jgi:hypothetical protein
MDGVAREPRIVLLSREALFLGGGHDPAVRDEGGRAVVVERGESQHPHGAAA